MTPGSFCRVQRQTAVLLRSIGIKDESQRLRRNFVHRSGSAPVPGSPVGPPSGAGVVPFAAPSSVGAPAAAAGPAAPGDMYQSQAAFYADKARQFLAAGNVGAAQQFSQAAMVMQSMGVKAAQERALADQEQSKADQAQAKTADIKARSQYVVVDSSTDQYGLPQYRRLGAAVSMYGPDGTKDPQFASNIQSALAAAQQSGAQNPAVMSVSDLENSKANVAATAARARVDAALLRAQSPAGGSALAQDQDALDQATGMYALRGPQALTRMSGADRVAVLKNLSAHGLSYNDATEASLQYTALQHAVNTGAARAGRVSFLSNEIPGQAQNVLDALNGVDRTRIQAVNGLIAGGKTQFSDPGEARYATAIQGLLTPYSLLIAGATGQSSDAARSDAYSILTRQQGPDAVKAVIDQIVNKELAVAKSAGDATIEMASNSRRYSALAKVAAKLGVPFDSQTANGSGITDPTQLPLSSASSAASGSGPSNTRTSAAAVSVPTATGPGGTKLYLVNGQWTARSPAAGGASGSF